jgi:hypothetical protein
MTSPQRDWIVLLATSIAFCVALLIEPDWNLQEAHLLCAGQPVQVFESMTACSVNLTPACPCVRPQNPWVIAYWLAFLTGAGIAAALLLRMQSLLSAVFLVGAMAVGGYCGLLLLSQSEMFEPEAWAYAPFSIAAQTAITLVAFGLARLARHLVVKRQPST